MLDVLDVLNIHDRITEGICRDAIGYDGKITSVVKGKVEAKGSQ